VKSLIHLLNGVVGFACRTVLYITLSVTFFILSANVALRYAAGSSLAWASELPELLFPWMIMSGVVLAAQHGSHIAVVIVTQRMGAARRWVLSAGALAVAYLYAWLAWIAVPLMEIAADERTPIMGVPGSVTVGCLMLGFVLLAIVTLSQIPGILSGENDRDNDSEEDNFTGVGA
jgi:TRAP-type C4-dicarboxylate transport system permease small subunit